MTTYSEFLEQKRHLGDQNGFAPSFMPDFLFDFQKALVNWSVRQGRAAMFADCGMGKTPMQLVWSQNVIESTNRPVLILTPLAVSQQTVREGEKFGIQAIRTRNAKEIGNKGAIFITNYEQLHHFDPTAFAGVVCDECFPADTLVDTPLGQKRIDTLRKGDKIINASGVDAVSDVHRREVQYAIKIKIAKGAPITTSPNHPLFTQRGWVCAQELEPGDRILQTAEAVRILRGGIHSSAISSERTHEVLREILLREMADETASAHRKDTHSRNSGEEGKEESGLVYGEQPDGDKGEATHRIAESDEQPGSEGEGEPNIEADGAQAVREGRERHGIDSTAKIDDGSAGVGMDRGTSGVPGQAQTRVSKSLQTGLSGCGKENQYRGGWSVTPSNYEARARREEGYDAGFSWVDGIEILERGHPELERLRAPDGKLYFHDLGATRHPSYSVQGLLVHNSSILKSFDGVRRGEITAFMRKMRYRLLCTATAAPNDYTELGTSSEALGYLGHIDMLNRFFKNDRNNSATGRMYGEVMQWRLKHHAEEMFWRWVCSWARAVRKPSDLGFDDGDFHLPPLVERENLVEAHRLADGMLFDMPAQGLREQREEQRRTIRERCERMAELVDHDQQALLWCHLNDEGNLLKQMIPGAVQVAGADSDEVKEERFLAFASGEIRALITKPKIGAWGLNFQNCAHVAMFPSHSFEQYYQAVRRCWRFGQTKEVIVDMVMTEGGRGIFKNLQSKASAADKMFSRLVELMNDSMQIKRSDQFTDQEQIPTWL